LEVPWRSCVKTLRDVDLSVRRYGRLFDFAGLRGSGCAKLPTYVLSYLVILMDVSVVELPVSKISGKRERKEM
jgi:hypothetical protein